MKMKYILSILFLVFLYSCNAQTNKADKSVVEDNQKNKTKANEFNYGDWLLQQSIPGTIKELFSKKNLGKEYSIIFSLNPFYLRGNFNSDSYFDYAVTIKHNVSGKRGILIASSIDTSYQIIGAGNSFYNGGDDFTWMNIWHVYESKKIEALTENDSTIFLKSEGIWVEKSEAASAIIYWDGNSFKWMQQGD